MIPADAADEQPARRQVDRILGKDRCLLQARAKGHIAAGEDRRRGRRDDRRGVAQIDIGQRAERGLLAKAGEIGRVIFRAQAEAVAQSGDPAVAPDGAARIPELMVVAKILIALSDAAIREAGAGRGETLRVGQQKGAVGGVAGQVQRSDPAIADPPVEPRANRRLVRARPRPIGL